MFHTLFNRRCSGAARLGAGRQRGTTFIEVLIALVLTSILVLGLSGLWANVSHQFLYLTLKQKAVFVLNGEMERFSALYRFDAGFNLETSTGYDVDAGLRVYCDGDETTRLIYQSADVYSIVTSLNSEFDCGDNTCAGHVLYDPNVGTANRNYVWIDQQRKVTAEVSWCLRTPRGVDPAGYDFCSNGTRPAGNGTVIEEGGAAPCQELTVFLEFPFRYIDAANPDSDMGKTETLTLITIVGRRL